MNQFPIDLLAIPTLNLLDISYNELQPLTEAMFDNLKKTYYKFPKKCLIALKGIPVETKNEEITKKFLDYLRKNKALQE